MGKSIWNPSFKTSVSAALPIAQKALQKSNRSMELGEHN